MTGRTATVGGGAMSAVAAQLSLYAINFVTSVLLAHAVGPSGRGQYAIASMAVGVTVVVAALGVETANSVFFAERGRSLTELSGATSRLALLIGPVAVGGLAAAYALLPRDVFAGLSPGEFAVALVAVPFALHSAWLMSLYYLARRLARSQVIVAVGGVAQLATVAALAAAGRLDVPGALAAYLVGVLVPWALLVVLAAPVARVRPSREGRLAGELVRLGSQFQAGLLFRYLLLRFDAFLVAALRSPRELGLYTLAVVFADLIWLVTNQLSKAMIPFGAALPRREAAALAFKAARIGAGIAVALGVAFAATLWLLIPAIYGEAFSDAYPALVALLPGALFLAAAEPLGQLTAREQRPRRYVAISLAGFALNLALNLLLLPPIGIVGASLASSAAYLVFFVAMGRWGARIGGTSLGDAMRPRRSDLTSVGRALRRLTARPA